MSGGNNTQPLLSHSSGAQRLSTTTACLLLFPDTKFEGEGRLGVKRAPELCESRGSSQTVR